MHRKNSSKYLQKISFFSLYFLYYITFFAGEGNFLKKVSFPRTPNKRDLITQWNKFLAEFMKYTSCVKCGFATWNTPCGVLEFILFHIAFTQYFITYLYVISHFAQQNISFKFIPQNNYRPCHPERRKGHGVTFSQSNPTIRRARSGIY